MGDSLHQLREALTQQAEKATQQGTLRFFKEPIQCYGVTMPVIKRIAKTVYKTLPDLNKSAVFELCEKLWQPNMLEEAMVACEWSYACKKHFQPNDLKIFKKWVQGYVTNWATCDTLCNHTVGTLLEMYPELITELVKWTSSKNRWMRRAAAVSLIVPARKGLFLEDVFKVADQLMLDTDDLVQKGYGWMLKVASQRNTQAVLAYVLKHKSRMPRTALRYAIEKMNTSQKAKAMAK